METKRSLPITLLPAALNLSQEAAEARGKTEFHGMTFWGSTIVPRHLFTHPRLEELIQKQAGPVAYGVAWQYFEPVQTEADLLE